MAVNQTVEQIIFEGVDKISAVSKQAASGVTHVRRALNDVKSALAAVGVTVGAGAFLKMYTDTLSATAALDDMSEATGASVEGLSAIQRVAKVGGHEFDGLTQQISKMIKGLKEGSDEGGVAAKALDFLGVKARDGQGRFRDMSEVLLDVAKSLGKYKDDGDKVALVNDILGRGSERYLPLLKEMAQGTDLHATVTARQAAEAEEAQKAINRLRVQFEDARRELTLELTPALTSFIEKLQEARKASGNVIAGMATMLTTDTGGTALDLNARIEELTKQIDDAERSARVAEKLSSFGGIGGWMAGLGGAGGGVDAGRMVAEREYLTRLRDARLKSLTAGMVQDASGEIVPEPDKARSGYKSPGKDDDDSTQRKKAVTDLAEEDARVYDEAWAAYWKSMGDAAARDQARADEFTQTLQTAAQYRQRLAEEQEARATELYEREKERAMEEIALIGTHVATEEMADQRRMEIENARYARQLALLEQYSTDAYEYDQLREVAEQEHQDRLLAIEDEATRRRFGINKVHRKLDLDSAKTFFGSMSGLMNSNSRKMFEIGKIAAISETVINTYSAAMGAYKALASIPVVGPALGAAAAAAAIATGMSQVQAIRAQQFGGGGAGGAGGTFAANPITGQPVGTPGGDVGLPQRDLATVILQGETYSRKQVRDMFEALNEDMDDGGRFVVVERS